MRLVPLVAVLVAAVLVGCRAPAQRAGEGPAPTPTTPGTYFDGAIELRLVGPSEVRQWEVLRGLDVVMTNRGEADWDYFYSGDLLDFQATDSAGRVAWRHLHYWVEPLGRGSLGPGESKRLGESSWSSQGRWDLRDSQGFPVDPGEYQLTGIVRLGTGDEWNVKEWHVLLGP